MTHLSVSLAVWALAAAMSTLAQAPPQSAPAPPAARQAARPQLGPNQWMVDSAHTAAQFSVKHMMVSTVRGTLGRVSGTVDYDGASIESVKASIAIDITAIDTGNSGRDNDLKSTNFFDVAQFPTATFTSTRVEAAGDGHFRLIGDLTMHGVTREVTLDVEGPSAVVRQQNGAQKIGASATTTIKRRDFGLNYNRMIEAGQVVGEEIHVIIDIELNKPPSA
jgi:polyisoprenoid-binding protein YceI